MNPSELSLFVFGIYVALMGLSFIFIPNVPLKMLKMATTKEPWIRILGLVMVGLAYYYLFTSTNGVTIFFWPTVYARFGVFLGLVVLVATKKAPVQVAGFSIIDVGGAVWTMLTLI
jgi:hypothetical protein